MDCIGTMGTPVWTGEPIGCPVAVGGPVSTKDWVATAEGEAEAGCGIPPVTGVLVCDAVKVEVLTGEAMDGTRFPPMDALSGEL
mmetsp:Transcript_15280/g.16651  ORF Transcript_15280/g.16651 Transcript_15280/m.16651 type:complete len:84 (+) Transcript_15280:198-449(+)